MASAGGRITAGVGANLIGQHAQDRNQEATCYVGNLDEQVTDELLWELAIQAGPVGAHLHLITCHLQQAVRATPEHAQYSCSNSSATF